MKTGKRKPPLTPQKAQEILNRDSLFFHPLRLDQIFYPGRRDQPDTRDIITPSPRPKKS